MPPGSKKQRNVYFLSWRNLQKHRGKAFGRRGLEKGPFIYIGKRVSFGVFKTSILEYLLCKQSNKPVSTEAQKMQKRSRKCLLKLVS